MLDAQKRVLYHFSDICDILKAAESECGTYGYTSTVYNEIKNTTKLIEFDYITHVYDDLVDYIYMSNLLSGDERSELETAVKIIKKFIYRKHKDLNRKEEKK